MSHKRGTVDLEFDGLKKNNMVLDIAEIEYFFIVLELNKVEYIFFLFLFSTFCLIQNFYVFHLQLLVIVVSTMLGAS